MSNNKIGKFLKSSRKEFNLTQQQFSIASGLGLRFIRELEQGKKTVRLDKVNQALRFFGKEVGIVELEKENEES